MEHPMSERDNVIYGTDFKRSNQDHPVNCIVKIKNADGAVFIHPAIVGRFIEPEQTFVPDKTPA
jgi:hypothetical protein